MGSFAHCLLVFYSGLESLKPFSVDVAVESTNIDLHYARKVGCPFGCTYLPPDSYVDE